MAYAAHLGHASGDIMMSHSQSLRGSISVARNFTRTPGPRFKHQGPFSGEAFRTLVAQLLISHDHVEVDLGGTVGYGSSFLDEAFGGLIRNAKSLGLDAGAIQNSLTFKSAADPSYAEEARKAVSDALAEMGRKRELVH